MEADPTPVDRYRLPLEASLPLNPSSRFPDGNRPSPLGMPLLLHLPPHGPALSSQDPQQMPSLLSHPPPLGPGSKRWEVILEGPRSPSSSIPYETCSFCSELWARRSRSDLCFCLCKGHYCFHNYKENIMSCLRRMSGILFHASPTQECAGPTMLRVAQAKPEDEGEIVPWVHTGRGLVSRSRAGWWCQERRPSPLGADGGAPSEL